MKTKYKEEILRDKRVNLRLNQQEMEMLIGAFGDSKLTTICRELLLEEAKKKCPPVERQ